MYIKDHMTKNPFTIKPDTSVSKALDIMGIHKFHRLPVVDDEGRIVGLITEGLISDSSGKNTTSLSIYELNYLLSRTKASEIMIKNVVTITEEAFIEEAAKLMAENGVGVLPVVDDDNKVLGIITDKDVFTAFSTILGYRTQGTRFVISIVDKPGEFEKVCHLFAENNANIENMALYRSEERGTEAVVKATGAVAVDVMTKALEEAGFELRRIVQTDTNGNRTFWK